jgi:hypothetical protein
LVPNFDLWSLKYCLLVIKFFKGSVAVQRNLSVLRFPLILRVHNIPLWQFNKELRWHETKRYFPISGCQIQKISKPDNT